MSPFKVPLFYFIFEKPSTLSAIRYFSISKMSSISVSLNNVVVCSGTVVVSATVVDCSGTIVVSATVVDCSVVVFSSPSVVG